jgi:hypothetical protein
MFLEPLESRVLLSVSPVSAQVTLDRAVVNADLLKFRADAASCNVTLLADCQALKLDDLRHDSTLMPLFTTLHTDVTAMQAQLLADRLAQSAAVLQAQANVVKDLQKIAADRGNATALTADRAKLLQDRIAVQTADINGLNARIATRQADYTTISADLQAISTAVSTDANASPKLAAAVQKFNTDRTTKLNTMLADLQKVQADRTTLSNDLAKLEG